MEKGRRRMPGFPRDLAVLDPWDASLRRSRERRARAAGGRKHNSPYGVSLMSSPLAARGPLCAGRDLADEEPWVLSLRRSRERRRAVELPFVPASARAK